MAPFRAGVALLALIACGDNTAPERELDAGELDAGACVVWPEAVRQGECKTLCADSAQRCVGATGAACYAECAAYGMGTSYCPVL